MSNIHRKIHIGDLKLHHINIFCQETNSNLICAQERINIHYSTPVVAEVKEEVAEAILDEIMEERMVQVILYALDQDFVLI